MNAVTLAPGPQIFERAGAKIVFDVEVPEDGQSDQLLVLVNGFQRPRGDFRAFRKRLKGLMPQLATLALDNRGTGESELVGGGISVPVMAEDVLAIAGEVRAQLGLSTMSVLGISMGGLISLAIALEANQSVAKLILVSTTAGGRGAEVPPWLRDESKAEFKAWPTDKEGMVARMLPYFGERFLQKSPLLFEMMIKNMLKRASTGAMQEGSKLQYAASRSFDASTRLDRIVCPALIVTGAEDRVMPPANSEFLENNLLNSRLVRYEGVGHLILIEEPEKFVADVVKFLQTGLSSP